MLNKELNDKDIIGIISLDVKNIDKENNNIIETINNKLIYKKIFEDYDYEKSIKIYLEDGIKFLNILKNHDMNSNLCNKKMNRIKNMKISNFRKAKEALEDEIKSYQNE